MKRFFFIQQRITNNLNLSSFYFILSNKYKCNDITVYNKKAFNMFNGENYFILQPILIFIKHYWDFSMSCNVS